MAEISRNPGRKMKMPPKIYRKVRNSESWTVKMISAENIIRPMVAQNHVFSKLKK
jgi:hypothetical protein